MDKAREAARSAHIGFLSHEDPVTRAAEAAFTARANELFSEMLDAGVNRERAQAIFSRASSAGRGRPAGSADHEKGRALWALVQQLRENLPPSEHGTIPRRIAELLDPVVRRAPKQTAAYQARYAARYGTSKAAIEQAVRREIGKRKRAAADNKEGLF